MTDQYKNDERDPAVLADHLSKSIDRYAELTAPVVIVSLLATTIMWIVVIASPSTVAWGLSLFTESSSRGSTGVLLFLAVPFIFPFLAVHSIARARHPDIEDESSIKSGMMAGYNYRTRTDSRWRIWILAGMAGALNCLLLIVVYNVR